MTNTERITIRVSQSLAKFIKEEAERYDISRSAFIKMCLVKYLREAYPPIILNSKGEWEKLK